MINNAVFIFGFSTIDIHSSLEKGIISEHYTFIEKIKSLGKTSQFLHPPVSIINLPVTNTI